MTWPGVVKPSSQRGDSCPGLPALSVSTRFHCSGWGEEPSLPCQHSFLKPWPQKQEM